MADVSITVASPLDLPELVANLRLADQAEVEAAGLTAEDAVRRAAVGSLLCWTARVDDTLVCMFGAGELRPGVGYAWMLGTPALDRHGRTLVRLTPRYIQAMLRTFPHLVNFVHAQNTTSVQWLRKLGFTLHEAQPYGPHGAMFHKFEMHA